MVASLPSHLQKPDFYQSKRIQLTSPILHIGSSVSRLNPFEYVQTDKKVYLPNQEALAKGLLSKGGSFFNDYIQTIEERRDITSLLKQAFGNEWWNAKDTNDNPIFPKETISQKLTGDRITDLRPMIRNGMGQLFIPGSSIKGAIRTAIAYHLLRHADRYQVPSSRRVSAIEETLREKLGQLNPYQQKFLDDELFMNSLFSEFQLTYQNRRFSAKGPNADFLRVIKVTDSQPLIEDIMTTKRGQKIPVNLSVVAEVIISTRFSDYLAKYKASIYAEMVRNVQTEFTLSLDTEMLTWFQHQKGMKLPFNNLDELVQICQEFTQEQWDYEHDYWQDIKNNPKASGKNLDFNFIREFYESEKCPYGLRLGWGSGMNGTTIDLLFADELREKIRDTCGLKAPGFEAPKSRRTVMNPNGEIKFVPGWVKFKSLE
ncbi:type III-A CRISPR-associated RAMP protein Csm5 [Nostocaceae cyanobacterium CENA369]|uniref:CRISPR system Cms protein Csm5 n=1 Tax=Dendronalium phyllosphericum CENA369 TaxID=1725256 RepID=A0A8J7I9U4_9NOST|nr:type III-A CRISPR-associated RAMP protein Csm5 [Dendronalium phyllosphericum]MBH8578084.1 type III-A CRISPR-associated RAMP protein Csm5 [Dendronalium phyllosphericum CENA369]